MATASRVTVAFGVDSARHISDPVERDRHLKMLLAKMEGFPSYKDLSLQGARSRAEGSSK
jgi:hypothetical protein